MWSSTVQSDHMFGVRKFVKNLRRYVKFMITKLKLKKLIGIGFHVCTTLEIYRFQPTLKTYFCVGQFQYQNVKFHFMVVFFFNININLAQI